MREWYVIRLGRTEDTSKPRVYPQGQQELGVALAEEDPMGNRIPVLGRERRQPQAQPQVQQAGAGHGYFVKPVEKEDKSGYLVHTTEEAAQTYAKELAAKYPKVMFGVFSCTKVYETTEPTVITKTFNGGGELIIEDTKE